MAQNRTDNFKINAPKILDSRYYKDGISTPYSSKQDAFNSILYKVKKLTFAVMINGVETECWFRDGVGSVNDIIERDTSKIPINNAATLLDKVRANQPITIACQGTSMTYGQNTIESDRIAATAGYPEGFTRALYQYPSALEQTLIMAGMNVVVYNRGFSGDRTIEGLVRWIDEPPTDILILEYGHNDAFNFGGYQSGIVSVSDFKKNLSILVERGLSQGSWVLLTIAPNSNDKDVNKVLKLYQGAIREVAQQYNCAVIDAQEIVEWVGRIWSAGDNIHLNKRAYNEWGSQVAAWFIKNPNDNALKVSVGDSFSPWSDVLYSDGVTEGVGGTTNGNLWNVFPSTTYPIVVDMSGQAELIVSHFSSTTNKQFTVRYGNGITQGDVILSNNNQQLKKTNTHLSINSGKRILFVRQCNELCYIDNFSFQVAGTVENTISVIPDGSDILSFSYNENVKNYQIYNPQGGPDIPSYSLGDLENFAYIEVLNSNDSPSFMQIKFTEFVSGRTFLNRRVLGEWTGWIEHDVNIVTEDGIDILSYNYSRGVHNFQVYNPQNGPDIPNYSVNGGENFAYIEVFNSNDTGSFLELRFTEFTTGRTFLNRKVLGNWVGWLELDPSYLRTAQIHTSGSTVTVGSTTDTLVVNPTTLISNLAVTLKPSPLDKEKVKLVFGGTINSGVVVTSLTISGGTIVGRNSFSKVNAGYFFEYEYIKSLNIWFECDYNVKIVSVPADTTAIISTADAGDATSTQALVNELKATVNTLITELHDLKANMRP